MLSCVVLESPCVMMVFQIWDLKVVRKVLYKAFAEHLHQMHPTPYWKGSVWLSQLPVRPLKYYCQFIKEYPEIRNCRRRLFILFNVHNVGKKLRTETNNHDWFAKKIVEVQPAKNLPITVIGIMQSALLLSLRSKFSKVSLQTLLFFL